MCMCLTHRVRRQLGHVGFDKVYEGGHHEVYCTGKEHVHLRGDSCGEARVNEYSDHIELDLSECNCAEYK